jgi:hypothetical protein
MGRHHFQQLNSLTTAEGERGAAALSTVSTAQLQRIVALCAAILRETAESTDDLSVRLAFLQKGIESLGDGARAPRIACRRNPKCHPNPLFGPPCDCRIGDARGYDAH